MNAGGMPAADHIDHRRALGIRGEDIAAIHLRNVGMLILDRNWRPHGSGVMGEVDVIARDGDAPVIVEVKTRRSLAFGAPVEAVSDARSDSCAPWRWRGSTSGRSTRSRCVSMSSR